MIVPYLIATNADYTVIIRAESPEDAIQQANDFYFTEYGETRDDWAAYDLTTDEYLAPDEVLEIRSWME